MTSETIIKICRAVLDRCEDIHNSLTRVEACSGADEITDAVGVIEDEIKEWIAKSKNGQLV